MQYAKVHKIRGKARVHHKEIRQSMKYSKQKDPMIGSEVQNFNVINIRYFNFDNVKSVALTK